MDGSDPRASAARDREDDSARVASGSTRPPVSGLSVKDVRKLIAGASLEPGDSLWEELRADPRKGVAELVDGVLRRRARALSERARLQGLRRYEAEFWAAGAESVAGVDEAGRGPLAGPVVAAAVVLQRDVEIPGIDDSKRLTPAKREELYERIMSDAVAVGVGSSSEKVIDEINILRATFRAMREAVAGLGRRPDHVLVDGDRIPELEIPQSAIPRGDEKSAAIAAASIIAKVTRDRLLVEYDGRYPGYGFARHKGYGTPQHIAALTRLGPCDIHRRSFRIVHEARGGFSRRFREFRDALMEAGDSRALDGVAEEIARAKSELEPFELSKLRGLYKRCYVRLGAGLKASK